MSFLKHHKRDREDIIMFFMIDPQKLDQNLTFGGQFYYGEIQF